MSARVRVAGGLALALAASLAMPAPSWAQQATPAPSWAQQATPETGERLGAPRPGMRRPPRPRPAASPSAGEGAARSSGEDAASSSGEGTAREEPAPEEEPWGGPSVELGYTHYALVDGFGGGDVHAAFFGGYVDLDTFRLGASLDAGGRDYSLGQNDALLRGTVIAGYQHLPWRPFVPYAGAVLTLGVLFGKRFRTPVTHTLAGAGLEVGADLNLTRSLFVGVGLGWIRAGMQGVGHDLWVLRLRVGL